MIYNSDLLIRKNSTATVLSGRNRFTFFQPPNFSRPIRPHRESCWIEISEDARDPLLNFPSNNFPVFFLIFFSQSIPIKKCQSVVFSHRIKNPFLPVPFYKYNNNHHHHQQQQQHE